MRSIPKPAPPEYTPGESVIVTPPNATPFVATVIQDRGGSLVFIGANSTKAYAPRVILSLAASHLSPNETPQVANAHYRGVMNERIERSKQ